MLDALKRHWPAYLMEAGGLFSFMIGAGLLATLFLHPDSALHRMLPSDLLRHGGIGVGMGLVTFAIVKTIGSRSGAHINPAVTLTFYRQGNIGGWDAIFYALFQLAGAIVAPAVLLALIGRPFTHADVDYAASMPGPDGPALAFVAEFAISYILMLVVLVAVHAPRLEKWLPVIIGALIAIFIAFESPLSGMSMNPFRSFGSALTAGKWDGLWLYFVAPVAAMLLAAETWRRLIPRPLHAPEPRYPQAADPRKPT